MLLRTATPPGWSGGAHDAEAKLAVLLDRALSAAVERLHRVTWPSASTRVSLQLK